MKNIFLIISITILSIGKLVAQDQVQNKRENYTGYELKVNTIYLVLGSANVMAERSLSKKSAAGLYLELPFDYSIWNIRFVASPYYRYYLGKGKNTGLFVEGFATYNKVYATRYETIPTNDGKQHQTSIKGIIDNASLGAGLGLKIVEKDGLFLEMNFGISGHLFHSLESSTLGKGGLVMGYRF